MPLPGRPITAQVSHRSLHLRTALLLLAFVALALPAVAEDGDALARGEAAWSRRADEHAACNEAVAAFGEAVAAKPDDLDARLRLIEALWFQGHFVVTDRAQAKKVFNRMTDLAEETVALAEAPAGDAKTLAQLSPDEHAQRVASQPRVKDAHFWAAISWGLWAGSHGNTASGFKGVAGKIRDHGEIVMRIDETFMNAGGPRILGRLNAATPRVPMFTSWIDPKKGIELLTRANALAPQEPRNPLYLAEALLEHAPERKAEALALLKDVAARKADPAYRVEQQENIDEARRVLGEQEGTSDGHR